MQDLKITIVQADLVWEDKHANLQQFDAILSSLSGTTDLIILPEMFSTGFSMNTSKNAEESEGETLEWMRKKAQEHQAVITGSFIAEANHRFYNRLHWVRPDGTWDSYDKRHLFSFANEEQHYSAGAKRLIVELKGWKICPLICYDLRFPVWSRNVDFSNPASSTAFDLLIYVANWPEARRKPWLNLLEARAHENQVYVAGVNRVGKDGNGINHTGDSSFFSPKGEKISKLAPSVVGTETLTLSYEELSSFRKKFTVWKDKDSFELRTFSGS